MARKIHTRSDPSIAEPHAAGAKITLVQPALHGSYGLLYVPRPNYWRIHLTSAERRYEVASTDACAHTFNMYSRAINASGLRVLWNYQYDVFDPPSIAGTQFNGVSYENSAWSWNTVAGGC